MDELLKHIGEANVMKKLSGDYVFYSTSPDYWQEQGVESVSDFEHWQLKEKYEQVWRKQGNRGFLPFDLDSVTTEELRSRLEQLQQG